MRLRTFFLLCALSLLAIPAQASGSASTPEYFTLQLRAGDHFENIFERTLFTAGATPARRISGYGVYIIKGVDGRDIHYTGPWEYYGRLHGGGDATISIEPDGVYQTSGGKRQRYTDSSGFVFNSWLWGTPPATIAAGTTWTNRIPTAWEVGPAGTQTVRVLSVDPANDRVVLEREGSGNGAPLGERLPHVDGAQTSWGHCTWKGIAIIRRGLIESDQLVIHHDIIVTATATKSRRVLTQIEQIELGQVPFDGNTSSLP